jgi:predicted adenylyl cyclase CyaB
MREVELKSVVDDLAQRRKVVEAAGGILTHEGRLIDKRYGDPAGNLMDRDHVLRVRVYDSPSGRAGSLDWKGPTSIETGYKVRDEISTPVADPDEMSKILENLGYSVILEIERSIWQYQLGQTVIRFEQYPRMDTLVEVEGDPAEIESAIAAIGLDRGGFTSERLASFVARFEARTGQHAALSSRELAGNYDYFPNAT